MSALNSATPADSIKAFTTVDGFEAEIERREVIDAWTGRPAAIVLMGKEGPWVLDIEMRGEVETWLGRELGTMASVEMRGHRYPLLLCKRHGSRLRVKCPHCSKSKGEPVYHSHGWGSKHCFAECKDPASPFRKTGYILAPEQPRTREEMVKRVVRALLNRAPLRLALDDVKELTELIVEVAGDPRWGYRPTVEEVMRMYSIA
jgi:hypothetical protein